MSTNANGDSAELEALFDSIADEKQAELHAEARALKAAADVPAGAPATPAVAPVALPGAGAMAVDPIAMFQRIGNLTRQLHDALCDVGAGQVFERAAREFPDARDRLSYIARLTEQAAERTLNAVEVGQTRQKELNAQAVILGAQWDKFFARDMTLAEFRKLAQDSRMFAAQAQGITEATRAELSEIMMAQDFQDLTGQVIQKLTRLVGEFENQLLRFLIEALPAEKRAAYQRPGELAGPAIDENAADVVTDQEQVDDLLESLGF